ncbi:hypothetical protein MYCTH_2307798 [Thermothelomyces thermophilus ATCC 42464]|uniref:DUF8021 domain-containing protein n=1 Tax=Thermothelomyces thermophilus (strain ATCC 42464 / BCRC 31852 / DSM 1799) TaxID=573729 RepID=G2QGU7_THET4|nr:uncharacterized protein MYCTH_2307798 [Thermothelomyces thermophilus ATCC 42464]AEO59454.1 hypothetical protein MYCTH_2307798 [Thermothelomyces thermophilus ATCC 42464]
MFSSKIRSIFIITSTFIILLSTATPALAACTRADLLAAASEFVTAVSAGNVTSLPFSANFTYQENNRPASIGSTCVFSQPLKVDLSRSTADAVACASYTLVTSASDPTPPYGAQLPRGGSQRNNGNRKYVIDEVVGSVDVLCSFDALGSLPDSHEIRIEDGKVKYVDTVTA